MPHGWKIPPHWPFSCLKHETINLLLSKIATNNISAKRNFFFFFSPDDVSTHATSAPQRRVSTSMPRQRAQSAHNKLVSLTTWTNSLHAQTNPTRDPRVHPTRDPRPACTLLSGPHIYDPTHTYTAQPTRSPALQAQKHVTSPLAQTSRSSTASPDPRLLALQAHMRATRSSAKRTTPFNSPSTSSRVQMTHFPDLCPVFDPIEKHNSGHQTQSYRCLSLRPDKG